MTSRRVTVRASPNFSRDIETQILELYPRPAITLVDRHRIASVSNAPPGDEVCRRINAMADVGTVILSELLC